MGTPALGAPPTSQMGGAINFPPIVPSSGIIAGLVVGDAAGGALGSSRPREPTRQEVLEMQIARFYEYIEHITMRQQTEWSSEMKRQHLQEKTPFTKFRDAMYDIFGDEIKVDDIKQLYRRISANPDVNVDWSHVFGYGGEPDETAGWRAVEAREKMGDDVIDDDKVIVTKLRRQVCDAAGGGSKRRDIVKQIIYIGQVDSYVVASQHGLVQVVTAGKYQPVTSMTVQQGDMLTTSCCFLPNLRRLAIATDRQLCIWDYRSPSRESFIITPFPSNILCVAAVTIDGPENSQFEDTVIWGDVEGYVGMVKIHQKDLSVKAPHKKNTGSSEDRANNNESTPGSHKKDGVVHLIDIANLSTPIVRKKVHDEWTVRVVYCQDLKMFGSCSPSSRQSFIADDLNSLKSEKPYTRYVSVDKGCNTFTYSDPSNIFVTGGSDKVLRIWHPGIWTKPAGKLYGHIFSIVDVAINDADQHIISLSSARLIRVWDIHTLTALQVFGDNENRPGERRIHCMVFDNKNEVLLTGSSVVDEWPMARKYHATILIPQTHAYAVLMMALNVQLGQLLTADSTAQLRFWELDTGRLLAQSSSPHGPNVEVVAAAYDPTGFRMATGGMNGSIRIWDFGSTQILKRYEPPLPGDDKTIIDLHFYERPALPGVNYVIGLGWGGKIKIFRDASNEMDLVELCDFSEPCFQEQDILFTPLIDDPVEAKKSILAMQEDTGKTKKKPVVADDGENNVKLGMAERHNSKNISFIREKSNIEDILRFGYNRGLYLSEDRRTLITGTVMGHLVQWDLRSMDLELRWKLPPSNMNDQPSGPGAEISSAVGDFRDEYLPTPVSNSSMIHVAKYEVHRVNSIIVVKPALPERKKKPVPEGKPNEEGKGEDEASDDDDDDDDDASGSRPGSGNGFDMSLSLNANEAAEQKLAQRQAESPTPTGAAPTKPDSGKMPEDDDSSDEEIRKIFGSNTLYRSMTLLVSAHQDSWIRFWTMGTRTSGPNRLVHKIQMEINSHPSAVTCLCTDPTSKFIAAGDYKGYICAWAMQLTIPANLKTKVSKHFGLGRRQAGSMAKLGEVVIQAAPFFSLKFRVSWRAHNVKVEDIVYYQPHDILLSASMDGSVRIWKGFSSKYLGFFGQPQAFLHTGKAYGPLTQPVLPDIDDKPVFPMTSEKVLERKRAARKIRDLPLIVDRARWERGASATDPSKKRFWQPKHVKDKYFNLLVKPKLTGHGPGAMEAGGAPAGAFKRPTDKTCIYRSLITYGVVNTDNVNPRSIDFSALDPKAEKKNDEKQQ